MNFTLLSIQPMTQLTPAEVRNGMGPVSQDLEHDYAIRCTAPVR